MSALRAGHSLVSALGLVAQEAPEPVGGEFRICFEEQNYGLELRTAMVNLVTRVPIQDLKIVSTAVLIQKESGGNLAEVLDKTSYVIRERFRLKRQVRVHTAQGRLTGWILTLLPPILGVALYVINPKTMSILWTNPLGVKLLYLSAAMTITGASDYPKDCQRECLKGSYGPCRLYISGDFPAGGQRWPAAFLSRSDASANLYRRHAASQTREPVQHHPADGIHPGGRGHGAAWNASCPEPRRKSPSPSNG